VITAAASSLMAAASQLPLLVHSHAQSLWAVPYAKAHHTLCLAMLALLRVKDRDLACFDPTSQLF
jgi:hypothetical protein